MNCVARTTCAGQTIVNCSCTWRASTELRLQRTLAVDFQKRILGLHAVDFGGMTITYVLLWIMKCMIAGGKQVHILTQTTKVDVRSTFLITRKYQWTYRASRSLSSSDRMSFSLTGPFTLRMIVRVTSSMNSTRTWVTPPREPVRPSTY